MRNILLSLFFTAVGCISLFLFFFPIHTTKPIQQNTKVILHITPIPTHITPTIPSQKEEIVTDEDTTPLLPQTIQITVAVTKTQVKTVKADMSVINLTIEPGSSLSIEVNKNANQCDVLTQALTDKKISQLLMKYDSSLDTNGVYQINTIGKENAVWWVYTVNGKSPNQGCNHIAANNNDTVVWKYIGQ